MNILPRILTALTGRKKSYKLDMPVGLELSDGDRARIYGWPDNFVKEVANNESCTG